MTGARDQFAAAIAAAGLTPPMHIVTDGVLHRFASNGNPNDDAGYYVFHDSGIPVGSFGCFRTGIKGRWRFDVGRQLTADEQKAVLQVQIEDRRRRQEEREFNRVAGKAMADDAFEIAYPAKPKHPYLIRKNIKPHHARQWCGRLVIPLWDGELLQSLQYISEDGEKRFLRKARVDGLFTSFGKLEGEAPIVLLAEGFATAATLFEITRLPTFAAMSASNLPSGAKRIKQLFPGVRMIVCADDDQHQDGRPNVGIEKAGEAARAVGGEVAIPDFADARREGDADFNDLAARRGGDVVAKIIATAAKQFEVRKLDLQAAIERLAALPLVEREQQRKVVGKQFGVRASMVDAAIGAILGTREKNPSKGRAVMFKTSDPWTDPVDGAELLDQIAGVYQKYVVMSRHAAVAAALWAVSSYLMDIARISTRLLVSAPEKRCGKSRFIDVTGRLTHRAMTLSNVTAAALFRSIEAWAPTLLIDEFDTFGKDNLELRNIVNSGHSRAAAFVLRTEGDAHDPQLFSTWAPILIAMIGLPKGTILDRSITIKLRRKMRAEKVAKMRQGSDDEIFKTLRRKITRFALDRNAELKLARPAMPEGLTDRQEDNWELPLAIADCAGGPWPKLARDAAVFLSGQPLDADSMQTQLLSDVRDIFCREDADRITSEKIVSELIADAASIWNAFPRDKPITQVVLARMLRRFDVTPISIRDGGDRGNGYKRGADDKRRPGGDQTTSPLEDAFSRYLPPCEGLTPDEQALARHVKDIAGLTCQRCQVCKLRDKQALARDAECQGKNPQKQTGNTNIPESDDVTRF